MVVRPLETAADRERVELLLAASEGADGFPALGESKFVDFRRGGAGLGLVAEEAGSLVGYAHLLRHLASQAWEVELVLPPGQRELQIVEGLLRAARDYVKGRLLWWVFGSEAVRLAEQAGTQTLRELHKLRGALPPAEQFVIPAWAEVRPFRPGIDDGAWLTVNNTAFAGHLENGNWTVEDLQDRLGRDWFDVDGFRVAWAGERLVGFCWTKRHPANVGEIYVIGVDPEYQGKGLGRAIALEGMDYLARTGNTACILYVDTTNPSALELYRSLGFELERVDRCVVVPNG